MQNLKRVAAHFVLNRTIAWTRLFQQAVATTTLKHRETRQYPVVDCVPAPNARACTYPGNNHKGSIEPPTALTPHYNFCDLSFPDPNHINLF